MKLFGTFEVPQIIVDGADFNGSTNQLVRGSDLSGNADSKKGIVSIWFRMDANNPPAQQRFFQANSGASVSIFLERDTVTGKLVIVATNSSFVTILSMSTVAVYSANAAWRHILASWDMATAGARSIYVNDVADFAVTTFTNDTIDYTQTNFIISDTLTAPFNGCFAEFYFAPGQYLDFSMVANRRRFISAYGKPVLLGPTGALPTGVAPLVYQHLADTEAVANFATNRGTGGNFTIGGTLATSSTSPSD